MKKILITLAFILCTSIVLAQNYYVPELIYYRMHNNTTSTTYNFASLPVGTNPAVFTGCVMKPGGEFDTCLQGTGSTGSNGISTGWNCSLGSGNWTISFWIKDLAEIVAGNPVYLFGDPGSSSIRCLYGGYALLNHCMLRGDFGDIDMPCTMPGNYVFHIVYNGSSIVIYRNGIFLSSTPIAFTLPTGTGFRVAGYTGGTNSLNTTGKMDEFRLYNRALDAPEIAATWNKELPIIIGITGYNENVPEKYSLNQNYPNPFNPTTVISYSIIKSGKVRLSVTDLNGRIVRTLLNEIQNPGTYEFTFDAEELASGVYIYTMETESFRDSKKMILIK